MSSQERNREQKEFLGSENSRLTHNMETQIPKTSLPSSISVQVHTGTISGSNTRSSCWFQNTWEDLWNQMQTGIQQKFPKLIRHTFLPRDNARNTSISMHSWHHALQIFHGVFQRHCQSKHFFKGTISKWSLETLLTMFFYNRSLITRLNVLEKVLLKINQYNFI